MGLRILETKRIIDPVTGEPKLKETDLQGVEITDNDMLEMFKLDIMRDVCGVRPISSLNYMWVTARMKIILSQIEDALKAGNYKMSRDVYESRAPELGSLMQKRYALVSSACTSNDREALRAIASVFENLRAGFTNHIYWDDLLEDLELPKTKGRREQEEILSNEPNLSCSVM